MIFKWEVESSWWINRGAHKLTRTPPLSQEKESDTIIKKTKIKRYNITVAYLNYKIKKSKPTIFWTFSMVANGTVPSAMISLDPSL